jgi:hypothetical protein
MTKYCQHCLTENEDDAFWCTNCNLKIIHTAIEYKKQSPPLPTAENKKATTTLATRQYRPKLVLKTIFVFWIVLLCCILPYILFNNPHLAFGYQGDFHEIQCQINEDFWFDGNYLNTSQGWSFRLSKVKDYRLEGIILATKTYNKNDIPYDPCNIFSPIDLLIGIGDIQTNPNNYDYSIQSFQHRIVTWYLHYDDVNDYYYFQSHTGNNHIIPHTKAVLDSLAHNISTGVKVVLEGSLVNLYGTKGNQYITWTTDTHIGNYHCEIILVDSIEILDT